jgi:hypothetical protein
LLSGFFIAADLSNNFQGGIQMLVKRWLSYCPLDMAAAVITGAEDSIMNKDDPNPVCPQCGSRNTVLIVYGYPGPELLEKSLVGEVELGGCMVMPNQPNRSCRNCLHRWRETKSNQDDSSIWSRYKHCAVPAGLKRCPVCREYRGSVRAGDLSWECDPQLIPKPNEMLTASCLCEGILCGRCKTNRIHRPISNVYDPESNTIGHVPWFSGMKPCNECSKRKKMH